MRRILVLVVLVGGALAFRSQAAEEKKMPPKLELTADEKVILELTNQARLAEKLPPLTPNAALFEAARSHSGNMAKQDKLEHLLDGKRVSDRVTAAGYDYDEVAENVAVTDEGTAKDVVDSWLKSAGHRKNLLNPHVTEIGLGVAKNAKGEKYYTQVFAAPHKK